MLVKIKIFTIPTRTLPLNINTFNTAAINKPSTPISIIRSPHIDKKSFEHFKFFIQKRMVTLKEPGLTQLAATYKFTKLLKLFFATVRTTVNICYFYKFKTTF